MYGSRGTIGHMCPSIPLDMILNEVQRMLPDGVLMLYSTLLLQQHRQKDYDRAISLLDEAASYMLDGQAQAVIVGGGPVVTAIGSDESVIQRTRDVTRVPTISTTGAILAGLDAVGARRIAVASPYPQVRNDRLRTYLENRGYEVVGMKGLGMEGGPKVARLPFEVPYKLALDVANEAPNADAIYIPCARFPVVSSIGSIEAEIKRPVVTSTQAMVWWGLRNIGIRDSVPGFGRLYEVEPAVAG